MIKTRIYTNLDSEFFQEWTSLWDNSLNANYQNRPEWLLSVLRAFDYKKYAIITVYEKNKLVAVMPLVQNKIYGLTFFSLPPEEFALGDPFVAINTDGRYLRPLIDGCLSLGNVFFDNVTDGFKQKVDAVTSQAKFIYCNKNYYITTDADNRYPIKNKKRKEFLKNASKSGRTITLKSFDGTQPKGLDVVLQMDRYNRKRKRGYDLFTEKKYCLFYETLRRNFGKNFIIHVLCANNKSAAYAIGFISKTYYSWSQLAFNVKYEDCCPGKALIIKVIDDLAEKGIKTVDFGSGDARFKRELTKTSNNLYKGVISKNALVRMYICLVYRLKRCLYNEMSRNIFLYSAYRHLRKIVLTST